MNQLCSISQLSNHIIKVNEQSISNNLRNTKCCTRIAISNPIAYKLVELLSGNCYLNMTNRQSRDLRLITGSS